MTFFVVMCEHGPAWDDSRTMRQQAGWDEHAAFMDALVAEGFVVLGGPLGEGRRAVLVVDAMDEDDVRARLRPDPWMSARLLEIGMLEPGAVWLDAPGLRSRA